MEYIPKAGRASQTGRTGFLVLLALLLALSSEVRAAMTIFTLPSGDTENDTLVNCTNLAGKVVARCTPSQVIDRAILSAGTSLPDVTPFRGKLIFDGAGEVLTYIPAGDTSYEPPVDLSSTGERSTFTTLLIVYAILCVPFLVVAGSRYLTFRKHAIEVRVCQHCGFAGEMRSVLLSKLSRVLFGVLSLAGLIPGLIYFCLSSTIFRCPRCRRTRTIPEK